MLEGVNLAPTSRYRIYLDTVKREHRNNSENVHKLGTQLFFERRKSDFEPLDITEELKR